ncbi:MAG: creatininase family protein [Planctomycetota bacterium]|nr:creatininase family protein [Planctomycetota bacterium]
MRPWILAEANYAYVKENPYEVAVLPFGATEPHNLHLPYGTDLFEATILGEKICQAAHENGARPVLLPTIPYGTETNMHALPLAMNLNPSTLTQVTTDLVASLVDSNIRKVVLLNSHGGNGLKPLLRELYDKTEARLFLCNWFEVLADIYDEIFSEKEDHAGEMETSFGMAFFPELVIRNEDGSLAADEGATRESRFEAINRGWVSITRPWHLLTTNSGSGNPHAATKEKGEQMMQHLVERLGTFLVELSAAEIDDHFPFKP